MPYFDAWSLQQNCRGTREETNTIVIYRDITKAFDKCNHGIAAHKVDKMGITKKI